MTAADRISVAFRGAGLPGTVAALLVAAWLSFSPALLNDGDTSWHLATGEWILSHWAIPQADPFSFTYRGLAWTAHEWLADVVMAIMFRLGGWGALVLPFALSAAVLVFMLGRRLSTWLAPRYVLLAVAALIMVLAPFMLARPHLFTWPLLASWILILMQSRDEHRAPPLWSALLILLWANIHASFLIALGIAGLFGLEALIEENRSRGRVLARWGAFGLACLAAAFLTPHGVQAFLYPLEVSQMQALPLIQEWRATTLRQDWGFALFALAALAAVAWRWRQVRWVRFALLLLLLAMAIGHARHQPLFAITAVLILSARPPARPASKQAQNPALILGGLAAIALARLVFPNDRPDGPTYPASAIATLPAQLRGAPVFNDYSFGGPLILAGIAPFIDGRSDMYGDEFTIAQHRIVMGDRAAFDAAAERWKLRWTILQPTAPLVRLLDHDPRWRPVYRDRFAVVHVREPGARAAP